MKLCVIIPTIGRAELTGRTVARLWAQTRAPDMVIVAGASLADVEGVDAAAPKTRVILAPRGSCAQRNHALELIRPECDLVFFFDDDFVPGRDYLAKAEALFLSHPDIVGTCGRIVADGVRGAGYSFDEAVALLEEDDRAAAPIDASYPMEALYGCNMGFRVSALENISFDENLPLYGWLEDIDFSYRAGARGRLVKSTSFAGVHMGNKGARSPGRRLGYSQIANPIYLLRKRAMPTALARRLMTRQFVANVFRSIRPQPLVDHRGRFLGNIEALADLVRGRLDPRRILDFQ